MKKLYKFKNEENGYMYIGNVEFRDTPIGECYTKYGETLASLYGEDKIDLDQEVQAYTFYNGSNMESIILDDDEEIPYFVNNVLETIEGEEAKKILQNLPDPSVSSYNMGISVINNKGYIYHFDFSYKWEICMVEKEYKI